MLLLDLNTGDGRPIYGQIADRVKFAVAGGVLRPGELVPSVRELVEAARGEPEHGGAGLPRLAVGGPAGIGAGDGASGGGGGGRAVPDRPARDRSAAAAPGDRRGAAEQHGPRGDRDDPP